MQGGTSTGFNPTHVYHKPGKHSVSLKVVDSDGEEDSVTKIDLVNIIENDLLDVFVEPSVPSNNDCVKIVVEGHHNDSCFELISSHVIDGNNIEVNIEVIDTSDKGGLCLTVITPGVLLKSRAC